MADNILPEAPTWTPGIYQIETDDPVVGGPDGICNRQARELANRTGYLLGQMASAVDALAAHIASRNHPDASTAAKGFVQLATNAEAVIGTNTTKAVTPAALAAALENISTIVDIVAGTIGTLTVTRGGTGATDAATALANLGGAPAARTITAGNGLTGGGDLSANRTFTLGSPGTLTGSTANGVTAGSHTHAITVATQAQAEAGSDNTNLMTALRVKQAIDTLVPGVPTGTIIQLAQSTAPSGYLKANGAAVSRATYAALFAAIGTTFGAGNGGTTFNLPDLRGEFLRGWDDGRGVDSARGFGSAQADELKSHGHRFRYLTGGAGGGEYMNTTGGTSQSTYNQDVGNSVVVTGGAETRPRNIALLACIKY